MKSLIPIITGSLMIAALCLATDAKAQTTPAHSFVLSLAAVTGLPTGPAVDGTTFTLGGDVRLQYGLTDQFALTFTTGGYHFFPKQNLGEVHRESYAVGPIKGGMKVFFAPHIYFGAEAGVGYELTEHGFYGTPPKLLLAPSVGYANNHWDAGILYEHYSSSSEHYTYGQVALRVAYGFGL